jgi:hypothetical protein
MLGQAPTRKRRRKTINAVRHRFEITDGCGLLALVDQHAYRGFVGPDWSLDSRFAHFRDAMAQRSLLL